MALDMEGEFYKLARNILSTPKNLYKITAIGPKSGRLNIMGADGFVVVGTSLLRSISRMPEKKAFEIGTTCGKEVFGNLLSEFDEEIESLPPKKLMELGLLLTRSLGWGDFDVLSLDTRRSTVSIEARRTIELRYSKARHHMLTCGFLSSIASLSFKKDMHGEVEKITSSTVDFRFS